MRCTLELSVFFFCSTSSCSIMMGTVINENGLKTITLFASVLFNYHFEEHVLLVRISMETVRLIDATSFSGPIFVGNVEMFRPIMMNKMLHVPELRWHELEHWMKWKKPEGFNVDRFFSLADGTRRTVKPCLRDFVAFHWLGVLWVLCIRWKFPFN